MGFFNDTVTQVEVSVQPVLEEPFDTYKVSDSVLKAIMRGDNITDWILEDRLSRPKYNVDKMYKYAKEEYTHGLPNVTLLNKNNDAHQEIREILQPIIGKPFELDYVLSWGLDEKHLVLEKLQNEYGFDFYSKEIPVLSAEKGSTVYLTSLIVEVDTSKFNVYEQKAYELRWAYDGKATTNGTIRRLYNDVRKSGSDLMITTGGYQDDGHRYTYYALNTSALTYRAVVGYQYMKKEEVEGVTKEVLKDGELIFELDWIAQGGNYFHAVATYEETINEGTYQEEVVPRSFYWSYLKDTGTYPVLDKLKGYTYVDPGNTYLPFILFAHNRKFLDRPEMVGTQEYESTAKMLEFLGLDFQKISDGIKENPDSDKLEQAALVFGANIKKHKDDPLISAYMFEHLKKLSIGIPNLVDYSTHDKQDSITSKLSVPNRTIFFQDADYKIGISYRHIKHRYINESFGKRGDCRCVTGTESYSVNITRQKHVGKGEYETVTNLETFNVPWYGYQKQITSHLVEEIRLVDARQGYYVYRGYGRVATLDDGNSYDILFPLDKEVMDLFTDEEQDHIYKKSMHFVFNARVTEELKWYESTFFRMVIQLGAIFLTISTGFDFYTTVAAAFAAGGVYAAAMVIIEALVISQLISYGFKLFVEAVGIEIAFVIAVLALAYTGFQVAKMGSVKGAPFADEMINLANGINDGITAVIQEGIEDVADEWDLLREEASEMESEIKSALALLEPTEISDPLRNMIGRPFDILGESSDSYYTRSLTANPGAVSLQAVSRYTETALRLPTIHDTLGGEL